MNGEQAKEYGIIDEVIAKAEKTKGGEEKKQK
jgi:ATP-dependent protease ClpP protease subunit